MQNELAADAEDIGEFVVVYVVLLALYAVWRTYRHMDRVRDDFAHRQTRTLREEDLAHLERGGSIHVLRPQGDWLVIDGERVDSDLTALDPVPDTDPEDGDGE